MNDDSTRPLPGTPRGNVPQHDPSPYAGYVSQDDASYDSYSYDPYDTDGDGGRGRQWSPLDLDRSSYDDDRPPRRSTTRWLLPLFIALLGAAAFCVVLLLLTGGPSRDGATASPTIAQTSSSAPPSPSDEPTQSADSSTGASSSAESPSSEPPSSEPSRSEPSSAVYADFPAGTGTSCLGGTITEPDIQIRNGTGSSCAYVSAIKSQVLAHLAQDPKATTFTVSPYSVSRREYVPLTCSRFEHLTRCTGGRNVDAYVKDRVG